MKLAKAIAGFIVTLALSIVSSIFAGLVIRDMWGWFIVPVFGCDRIAIHEGMGMNMMISLVSLPIIVAIVQRIKDREEQAPGWVIATSHFVFYLMAWGISAAYHFSFVALNLQ